MKAIFLDKDGTLVPAPSPDSTLRPPTLSRGAGPALRLLARLDYRLFVVADEPDVAFGRCDAGALGAAGGQLRDLLAREQLELAGVYWCPHHPKGTVAPWAAACHCRKPLPGLLLMAAHDHGIDLRASWMVGDVLHDVEAGNRAGCRTILIDNGGEGEWRLGPRRVPTRMAPDLYTAAVLIASHGGNP